jgi:hypothetical protein
MDQMRAIIAAQSSITITGKVQAIIAAQRFITITGKVQAIIAAQNNINCLTVTLTHSF